VLCRTGHFWYSDLLVADAETHGELSDGARVRPSQHWDSIVVCHHTSGHHPRSRVLVRRRLPRQPVSSNDILDSLLLESPGTWILLIYDKMSGQNHRRRYISLCYIPVFRVTTLPGKSWNLVTPFSRPGKSWKTAKVMESHGKWWWYPRIFCKNALEFLFFFVNIILFVVSLVLLTDWLTSNWKYIFILVSIHKSFISKKYAVLIGHGNSFFGHGKVMANHCWKTVVTCVIQIQLHMSLCQ